MSGNSERPKRVEEQDEIKKALKKLLETIRGKTIDYIILDGLAYMVENSAMTVIEVYGLPNTGKSWISFNRITSEGYNSVRKQ